MTQHEISTSLAASERASSGAGASGSWLNLVEVFFSIITRQAIRRGSHSSVKDLIAAIGRFIDGWNERCHPFVWTKTADELLDHCHPGQRTSFTRPRSTLAGGADLSRRSGNFLFNVGLGGHAKGIVDS